jgi:hypothetical protein
MLDSGADISLLKATKLDKDTPINDNTECNIIGITPGSVTSIGTTNLLVKFNQMYKFFHKFHIVKNNFPLQVDGILGRDFLIRNKCQIDFDTFLLKINSGSEILEVPIFDETTDKTIVIPARSEVIKRISIKNMKEPHVVKAQEVSKGVFCSNTIVDERKLVKFINVNSHDVEVKDFSPQTTPLSNYHVLNIQPRVKSEEKDKKRVEKLISELNLSLVPSYARQTIETICTDFNHIFALSSDHLSTNNFYKQEIRLSDNIPVHIKNYRIPHNQKTVINTQVNDMLQQNVIEPSISPYNSPTLLVPKKGAKDEAEWRLVIDFRCINKKVIGDKYPLPRIEEILDQLGRAKYFSILDLKSGYHQIPISEQSRECTAFSTDTGHFQFKRLPFGLKVAGNTKR